MDITAGIILFRFSCDVLGKSETAVDMLRSILSQLEYRNEILQWERKGVPFRTRAYVPETHPLTGEPFHEREDEAHVFKVCKSMVLETGI